MKKEGGYSTNENSSTLDTSIHQFYDEFSKMISHNGFNPETQNTDIHFVPTDEFINLYNTILNMFNMNYPRRKNSEPTSQFRAVTGESPLVSGEYTDLYSLLNNYTSYLHHYRSKAPSSSIIFQAGNNQEESINFGKVSRNVVSKNTFALDTVGVNVHGKGVHTSDIVVSSRHYLLVSNNYMNQISELTHLP